MAASFITIMEEKPLMHAIAFSLLVAETRTEMIGMIIYVLRSYDVSVG